MDVRSILSSDYGTDLAPEPDDQVQLLSETSPSQLQVPAGILLSPYSSTDQSPAIYTAPIPELDLTVPMEDLGWSDLEWVFPAVPPDATIANPELASMIPFVAGHSAAMELGDRSGGNLIPNAQEPAARYDSRHGLQNDFWLPDITAASRGEPLTIPLLGADNPELSDYGSFFQLKPVDDSVIQRLQGCTEFLLQGGPWTAASLANLPGKDKVDHCIDLFFLKFQPVIILEMALCPLNYNSLACHTKVSI